MMMVIMMMMTSSFEKSGFTAQCPLDGRNAEDDGAMPMHCDFATILMLCRMSEMQIGIY